MHCFVAADIRIWGILFVVAQLHKAMYGTRAC